MKLVFATELRQPTYNRGAFDAGCRFWLLSYAELRERDIALKRFVMTGNTTDNIRPRAGE